MSNMHLKCENTNWPKPCGDKLYSTLLSVQNLLHSYCNTAIETTQIEHDRWRMRIGWWLTWLHLKTFTPISWDFYREQISASDLHCRESGWPSMFRFVSCFEFSFCGTSVVRYTIIPCKPCSRHGMCLGPFSGCLYSRCFIFLPSLSNIVGERIVRIWCTQQGLNREEDCSDL